MHTNTRSDYIWDKNGRLHEAVQTLSANFAMLLGGGETATCDVTEYQNKYFKIYEHSIL